MKGSVLSPATHLTELVSKYYAVLDEGAHTVEKTPDRNARMSV
jgi:hypothetical protein